MGADASKELVETDEYAQYNQGSEQSPGNSVGRKTSSVSRNMSQISGDDMDGEGQLIDGYLRPVQVSTSGFIPPEVEIMEGQGILFRWMEIGSRLEVVQVIHDGDKLRPVIGGFESKDPDCKDREGNYVQKFTLEGEYKFALLSVRCTPLNVVVKRRLPLRAILTDRGFEPRIVTIDQGNSIEWTWRQCTVPHSVQEVQYIPDRGCFLKNIDQDNANNVVRTVTGNYLKKFPRPGLYFYQTESSELDRVHLSAVRVQSSTREYKIEISDRSFNPSVLLIETGDRVWWYWDKYKCKKLHCVYEIMAPSLDQDDDEPYKPVEKGFRWTAPSKQGLLSYVFNEPGVYYFSDQNFQEAAEYIGTIIVKPKPKEHFVRLTESGFEPDIAQIKTGERLWFRWDSQVCRNRNQLVLVKETEKCVNPSSSPNRPETPDDDEKFQYPDEEALKLCTDVGYASVFMRNTGVYHYRISRAPDSFSTCSVIVNPGEKNHTIHLTDSGPEQKVIMSVRPHDRVWWVWQSTKKQHNVIQVSHQGDPIAGGFCSGMLRDSPSAFVHTFTNPGVFYYKSQNLPKIFGAVVVTTQPIVHTVSIGTEIKPDPVEVKLYDIVCWLLNRPRTDDVAEIETTDQVMGGQMQSRQITPRRCLNRAISRTGVLHYFSKSFRKQKKSSDNFMDDVRFSSIICDERYDNTVVRVDNEGFHPHFVYVKKGESVRWTWIGTDQEHNIIHVTAPDSKEPLNVVPGAKSFNSGKQVKNNSFLYTFDVTGSYSVASQGAPGYCCTVFVIDSAQKVQTPTIPGTSMNGGTVDRYQTVQLECETPGVKIFYTIDGTPPELHIDSARLYKAEKGVKLKETGLCFIRAMAVKEGMLNSEIFTSKRFWVLSKETDRASETTSESGEERLKAKPTPAKNENWDWWSCAPTIKACFTDPGVMEVFWEEPNAIQKKLIKGYMIFLNGVSYCEMFPPTNNSLSICGLAGNRLYEVSIEVYAVQKKQNPQTSNKLMMKCPLMTKEGGPIVSLERSDKPDALVVVWMSIDTKEYPIKGYLVFLNEQQCGSMLVPDQDKNRCKVFIGGCELHKQHKIYVVALPRDAVGDNIDDARMSNIIEVTLPLDFSQLQLPDELDRIGDEELYQEYLAVQEGAGYLPEMDDRRGYTQQVVEVEDPRFRGSSEDQSVMTDDNYEKSTQTPPGRRKIKTLQDSYDSEDLRQSRVAYRGKSPGGRRDVSESQSESETASDSDTESYSDSETESEASRISHDGSVVVVSMNKSKSGGAKMMRSSPRDTPREEVTALRSSGRGYVPLDRSEKLVKSDYSPRPPTDYSRSGRGTRAIIEVEDEAAEDFDASRALQSVTVTADRKHRRRIVQEGEYVYNEIRKEEDIGVPCPSVRLTSLGKTGVCVEWSVGVVNENYEVQQFIVNIVGRGFNTREINSHISFECNLVDQKGQSVRGTQHCWTLDGNRQKINIRGLYGGETYRIFVVANYGMKNSEGKAYEVQHTSSVIYYTTIGPPTPPMLRVVGVNFYRAKLEWDPPRMQRGLELLGYKVYVNNKPLIRGLLREDKRQMVIDDLIPGKTIGVYVKAILKQSEIESDPSREVHITCPRRPPPPHIEQQPLYKHGAVMIAWDKPSGVRRNANEESISKYEIYLNDKLYGEKTANAASDRQGYQFIINGLNPEQSYDVQVKSVAGQKNVDQDQSHIFCMSDSEVSNTVPVMAPASPKSPELRLENMSPNGIRVTWSAPQQYGGVEISGYRLLKNGKLYGDIMGPDVYAVDITGVRLGEKVVLQLVALTNHPVGKLENAAMHSTYERDSGSESSPRRERPDVFLGEKYAGCHPGPKLTLHYTGLVKSPSDVWFEQVTGHSALVVWTKEDNVQSHFVRPDHYVVTWWRGSHEKEDVRSEETKEDHLLITGLQPSTAYTVVVEARRMDYYKIGDDQESSSKNKFILTADSDSLLLKTARPPDPPSNLAVTASTCHGLRIVWDPPVEKGVEVIAIRIDAQSINTSDPHHMSFEVRPDENQADIEPLREKTDYVIRVTAVTDEYFDRLPEKHKLKKLRTLPRDRVVGSDDSVWLPNAYTMAKTAGTEPPANLKVIESSTTAMTISWVAPIAYGSNKLTGIVVRWSDVKNTKKSDSEWYVASHLNLDPSDNRVTVQDLTPGAQYKIVVEAVVSIKTSLENTSRDSDYEKYRRTANVMSKPLYARARAPTEPPRLYVTGYTQTTAQLYWEKPPLVSVIGKDSDGKPKYLRRYLEGYKLEINDRLHSCLGPNAQSCQLTKCKPGKKYNVVLVALTCTDQGKKERKRKYKGVYRNVNPQTVDYSALLQDEENLDPSPSDPQEIVLPTNQEGYVQAMDRVFKHDEDRDNSTFGDIELKWDIQGDRSDIISHVRQYNIIWSNNEDRQVQTKVVSADIRKTLIPVTRLKSVYDLLVEPDYFTDVLPQRNQRIQIVVPGPPDAPEIFLKSVSPEEFVIEWGEPRLYGGVRVRGYQVYLNDKKVGNELSNSHRKAVIPCRPNKNYKVQLVALSDNSFYSDSSKSNALHVNTSPNSPRQVAGEEWAAGDDQDMPVKVTQVTETSIHLDWNNFLETEGVDGYRIQWSSVAQPAQREVKLSSKDSSCIINNCLPGTTHFVRLVAMDVDGQILEKSRQMTIQTSAPPDSPVVTVRACNFRYIAVQWEKPNTYGDALVTGYKVYVNGIVESILNADQLSYTFTHGKWCQEYAFQIQALTSYDKLHSKVSEPLVVVWPGCRAPALRRLPTHSSSNIRIAWDDPYLTDGVKVKHFRAVCLESDTEKEVTPSIGPIHPHTREAEFKHLKRGSYSIHLEVHLYNTGDILCSEPIHVSPAPAPDPPRVTVTVVGLDERRALERLTCDLVNKRDRLIRKVGHKLKEIGALSHPLRAERNHAVIEGAQTLSRIEEILEDCFAALDHFTGQLIAHVSWSCPQSRSETQITGYKLLIDGKQYGSPMHDGIKTVRIKLGTEEPQHKLSMLSMTDKPQATSDESNTVDLLTETFRPFSFYCYHSIHNQAAKWPSHGCCKYQDSILYERQLAKKLANQGLLRRKVPPPSCSLLDIFEGEYKPLLGSHNKQFATCIFFWTPWCLSSQKVMASFSRFAREASSEFNFIAVTCGVNATQATDRKALIHSITSNGWREDGVIWHCTSQCASAIHEATNNVWKNSTAGSSRRKDDTNESFKDLTEILGIAGVPTFLFVHPDGYIAWHGRYSAYDYASFGAFMRHTFSEVIGTPCPVFKCDLCKNDMTIDEDALEPVLQLVRESPTANLNMRFPQENRPPSPKRPDSPVSTDQNYERLFLKRKQQSPKSKKKKLTVNHRPYSASTYVQLLKSPYMQKTVPSPKVLNKLLRPQSGGARLG